MTTKTMLSLVFSATLVLAILGNLILAKKMVLAAVLVLAVLGVGILSHLAFFEEKKKRKNGKKSLYELKYCKGSMNS